MCLQGDTRCVIKWKILCYGIFMGEAAMMPVSVNREAAFVLL